MGNTRRGKGTKLMAIAYAADLPLAVYTDSASPHEVALVEATVDIVVTSELPERLFGDRTDYSDPPDKRLAVDGIDMIALH